MCFVCTSSPDIYDAACEQGLPNLRNATCANKFDYCIARRVISKNQGTETNNCKN